MSALQYHSLRLIVFCFLGQAIYLIYSQMCFFDCVNYALMYELVFRSWGYSYITFKLLLHMYFTQACVYLFISCSFNLWIILCSFWLLKTIIYKVLVLRFKGNYLQFYFLWKVLTKGLYILTSLTCDNIMIKTEAYPQNYKGRDRKIRLLTIHWVPGKINLTDSWVRHWSISSSSMDTENGYILPQRNPKLEIYKDCISLSKGKSGKKQNKKI